MAGIVESIQGLITSDLSRRAGSLLGESDTGITKAFGAAVPTILGTLAGPLFTAGMSASSIKS